MRTACSIVFLVLAFTASTFAQQQTQPANIWLNPNGESYIYPVFDYNGWTQTFGSSYHAGDDAYAQDWARGCGQTAWKKVYAGISGRVVLAENRQSYGNTVVIYDQRAGFALRYAHLYAINVERDQLVVAGITEIGKVGKTGINITSTTCQTDPGAHLHLTLYKNVTDPQGRPVIGPTTSGGATNHAASFGYMPPVMLIKGDQSPTVYVYDAGTKRPVTAFSYETNGWGFNPTRTQHFVNIWSQSYVDTQLPTGPNWSPRSNILLRGSVDQTVYVIEDGARRSVPSNIFSARGWDFADVRVVSEGEQNSYLPYYDVPVLNTWFNDTQQAIKDMAQRASWDGRFDQLPLLHQYSATNMLYDPNWEWRQMLFRLHDGRHVWMAHIIWRYNPTERYTEFWDPDTGQNTGWVRAQ